MHIQHPMHQGPPPQMHPGAMPPPGSHMQMHPGTMHPSQMQQPPQMMAPHPQQMMHPQGPQQQMMHPQHMQSMAYGNQQPPPMQMQRVGNPVPINQIPNKESAIQYIDNTMAGLEESNLQQDPRYYQMGQLRQRITGMLFI